MSRQDNLIKDYSRLNALYFHGALPPVKNIRIRLIDKDPKELGYAGCTFINNRRGKTAPDDMRCEDVYYYCIDIVDYKEECTYKKLLDVLAHEMIHLWQWDVIDFDKYAKPSTWYESHNKVFIAKMNQINTKSKEFEDNLNICVVDSGQK